MRKAWTVLVLASMAIPGITARAAEMMHSLGPSVRVTPGPINGVQVQRDGRTLVVYGDPTGIIQRADMVLFTHTRRDVIWAARGLIERGAKSVVPASEAKAFTGAADFWKGFFQYIRKSDFLMGRNSKWQATFDWIINESNFVKILEGNFHK